MIGHYTDSILMIRPSLFNYNIETAGNNYYQKVIEGLTAEKAQEQALKEFDEFVVRLKENGINVTIVQDTLVPETPDSIFPNNWISFHNDGSVILYPMFAETRRGERRYDIPEKILPEAGFKVNQIMDTSGSESENKFLEGTGSLILDRVNRILYASISDRTNAKLVEQFSIKRSYEPITFTSYQSVAGDRLPIYHTNVMMCLGDKFSVICLHAIGNEKEREIVRQKLIECEKEIIEISETQTSNFAGNMLQLANASGDKFIVMSTSAYNSLDSQQINTLQKYGSIIHSNLDTIEACGGGSARCMIAEVFLPPN